MLLPELSVVSNHVSGIYAIVNKVTGAQYIGSAVGFRCRWRKHIADLVANKHHSPRLQFAWNKHGEDTFTISVLEVVPNKSLLIEREQYWMDTLLPEYNVVKTAGSPLGYKHPEAFSAIVSNNSKRMWQDPQVRAKMAARVTELKQDVGYNLEKSRCLKIGQEKLDDNGESVRILKLREARQTEESRQKTSAASKKMWQDPEMKAQYIAACKITNQRADVKERRSKAARACTNKPEYIANHSIQSAARWADKDYRDKVVSAMKAYHSTPEAKEKKSIACKKMHAKRREDKLIAANINTAYCTTSMTEATMPASGS